MQPETRKLLRRMRAPIHQCWRASWAKVNAVLKFHSRFQGVPCRPAPLFTLFSGVQLLRIINRPEASSVHPSHTSVSWLQVDQLTRLSSRFLCVTGQFRELKMVGPASDCFITCLILIKSAILILKTRFIISLNEIISNKLNQIFVNSFHGSTGRSWGGSAWQ